MSYTDMEPWLHDALVEHHTKGIDTCNRQIAHLIEVRAEHEQALDELYYGTPENVEEP